MSSSKKRAISLKNSSPDLKADLGEKSLLGIWDIILSRRDIILHIEHVILDIFI